MLHDSTQEEFCAIIKRINVNLDRIIEESIDQNRVIWSNLRRLYDELFERFIVIDDLHTATTEDK